MRKLKITLLLGVIYLLTSCAYSQQSCMPQDGLEFICGPANAEDLVMIPESNWIIASATADAAEFYLIDSNSGDWNIPVVSASFDNQMYSICPSSPVMAELETHGLNIRATGDKHSTLYVVGHGAREAIEIFDVDASGSTPELTWIGCVLMPEGLAANSVASFADGSFVTTVLLMPGKTFGDSVAMRPTGAVFKWSPGDSGLTQVGGTELPGNNGIEVSADETEIYVVSSGFQTIVTFTNTNPARQLRTTQQLPITPDNVHLGVNGMLLTAGMKNDVPACGGRPGPDHDLATLGTCPRGSIAIEIDPRTMQERILVETPESSVFSNATMVLLSGNHFWFGTFGGDRVAHGMLP